MNITVGGSTLSASQQAFKLQYGQNADCTAVSSWTDVGAGGSGTIWRYATSGVSDQTTLTASKLASSDVLGAYAKANATVTNPNSVSAGQDMEWDFHLEHNAASTATTYCFRVIKSDDSTLDTYNADSYGKLETEPDTGNLMRGGDVFVDGAEKGMFWTD